MAREGQTMAEILRDYERVVVPLYGVEYRRRTTRPAEHHHVNPQGRAAASTPGERSSAADAVDGVEAGAQNPDKALD